MILLILAAVAFYRGAKKRELIPWLWAVIAVVSYFMGQVIVGVFLGMTTNFLSYDDITLTIYGLLASLGALILAYIAMIFAGENKKNKGSGSNENLIDDEFRER